MKFKKMNVCAWALAAAMGLSVVPMNMVSVEAADANIALTSTVASSVASKVLDANTLEIVDYIADTKVGDFTFVATGNKPIFVTKISDRDSGIDKVTATDGKEFTVQMKFQGGADQIKFDAGKGAKVTVYYQSGGSDPRELGFYSSAAAAAELAAGATTVTPLATSPAPAIEAQAAVATFDVAEAGEYYIASVTKGMLVYYINVEEAGTSTAETPAQTETTVAPTGNTYTVQKGDTLCAIARKLFNAEAKWSDLYNWNKATIKDPALIYIGQVLSINGETVSAPAETTTPSQAATATATAEPTLKYSVDVDGLKEVPAELASYFVVASQWDRNIMKFAEKTTRAVLPMTATTGNVKLEMEMNPAGKTAQSIIFKNSAGEQVLVIGNNIGNKTIVDGTYYFTDTVAEMYSDEAATAVKSLQDIAVFPKNTWLKLTIEIDTAKSEAKVTVIGYPEASKYSDDYSVWTNLGEATYTFTNSKADIAGIEIQSTDNARFVGDIALTY